MDNISSVGRNKSALIITIIILLIIIVLGVAGFFYWKAKNKAASALEDALKNAAQGVLPEIQTNPLENKPDLNPASNANPIKDIKINPF